MANLWYNLKYNINKHRRRLYSLVEAASLFCILFFLTKLTKGRSLCILYNVFHVRCMGCGMTRAFISILQLDFIAAFNYNILSIPLFIGVVLYCNLFLVDIFFGKEWLTAFERFLSKKYMYPIYFFLFLISAYLT